MVCLQETKLDVVDDFLIMQCMGTSLDGYVYLPAVETKGRIILAWDSTVLHVDHIHMDDNFLTEFLHPKSGEDWWISVVYGPQGDELKTKFLDDLTASRLVCQGKWMVLGDFNMILRASEKNNDNLNHNIMNKFRNFMDFHELKELYMHGRRFTWSNERDTPMLTKIDRVLVSVDWELANPDCLLQVLSTNVSDHAPLHLTTSASCWPKKRFRFQSYWLKIDGFEQAVAEAWVCDSTITDPFKRLDALFRNVGAALQAWGQRRTGNIKLLIDVATWLIFRLDQVMDMRVLMDQETWLRHSLKDSLLGLASLECTIDRQRSRYRWLKEGDANSKKIPTSGQW